jgi:tetratricopeptide (TPR) repeat protein
MGMTDIDALWDFDDPAGSEQRFRDAADAADGAERDVLLTQLARAIGLQERFEEAHRVLDGILPEEAEPAVRVDLERGRLYRSGGDPDKSRAWFAAAAEQANTAGLEVLHLDALHMIVLVAEPDEQAPLTEQALEIARGAKDPAARQWSASLLNNLGMSYADGGDFLKALPVFERALAAAERHGDQDRLRIARWMIAWSLRNLGRRDEALELQLQLKAEHEAAGTRDQYVDDEIALLKGKAPS